MIRLARGFNPNMENMEKHLFFFLSLLSLTTLEAQDRKRLSVELNVLRYSYEPGIFNAIYPHELTYLNGLNLGYAFSPKWQGFIEARRVRSNLVSGGSFSFEFSRIRGIELSTGVKFLPHPEKRFFLSYGAALFGTFTTQEGTYSQDHPPTYEINHRKSFLGIAPSVTLNFRLNRWAAIFTTIRARLGRVQLTQRAEESTQPGKTLYPNRSYLASAFDLVHALGIRVSW